MEEPNVVVVLPTYNERENLPAIVGQLLALEKPGRLHVVVVDDDSPDGTGEVADRLAEAEAPGRVSVLHRTGKEGLGKAYVAGMRHALEAGAEIVVQMDADLSHPVEAIPRMIDALRTRNLDVVLGSRYVAGGAVADSWPWHRRLLSAFANRYVAIILRAPVKDMTAGYKAWRAETLEKIDVSTVGAGGYAFQVEMNYRTIRCGMSIGEVPITFTERNAGASKMNLKVQIESALVPWRLRFQRRR